MRDDKAEAHSWAVEARVTIRLVIASADLYGMSLVRAFQARALAKRRPAVKGPQAWQVDKYDLEDVRQASKA